MSIIKQTTVILTLEIRQRFSGQLQGIADIQCLGANRFNQTPIAFCSTLVLTTPDSSASSQAVSSASRPASWVSNNRSTDTIAAPAEPNRATDQYDPSVRFVAAPTS